MPTRAIDGCSFGRDTLRLSFAGCLVVNCFPHNLLSTAMQAKRELSVASQAEEERDGGSTVGYY